MVDHYTIPWLIWIQMFVFFLLLLLLCLFGIVSSDIGDDNNFSSADSPPSSSGSSLSRRFLFGDRIPISHRGLGFSINSSLLQSNQMGSSRAIKGEIEPAITGRVTRREEEEESSSDEDSSTTSFNHPCNWFQLAGIAFLKCFGLDRSTEETTMDDSLRPESKKQR